MPVALLNRTKRASVKLPDWFSEKSHSLSFHKSSLTIFVGSHDGGCFSNDCPCFGKVLWRGEIDWFNEDEDEEIVVVPHKDDVCENIDDLDDGLYWLKEETPRVITSER